MRTTISLCLALLALSSAQAEVFRSSAAVSRTVHHARAHGGDHDRHRTSVHVGIGFGSHRHWSGHHGHHRHHHYHRPYTWAGYRHHYYSPVRYVPTYAYYPAYGYDYPYYSSAGYYGSESAASRGLVLGALAGGIIGHNSGEFRHNGWRGAAWGAGLGWLVGSVVDANRRAPVYQSVPTTVVQAAPVEQTPTQSAPQPQQVTIINNYYNTATPMSSANTLFGR